MKYFKDALNTKDFVITSEIFLKPETDAKSIKIQADVLRDYVDAILLTDNQSGQLHMSSLAAGVLLLDAKIDPIIQLSCRNRNRISLLSDLMGCAALGMTNLSLIRGDRVPNVQPKPKAIMDITATELIRMANKMKADEKIKSVGKFLLGGVVTPHGPKPGWQAKNITEKIDAGAQFVLTHTCLDVDLLRIYMQRMVETKLLRRVSVIVGMAVLSSSEDAQWVRLSNAKYPEKEGIDICVEQINALKTIPGVSGAHIIASEKLTNIPTTIKNANI